MVKGKKDNRWRWMLKNLKSAVYLIAREEGSLPGRFLYVSPRVRSITGLSKKVLRVHPGRWLEIIHPDDRDAVLAALESFWKGGGKAVQRYRINPEHDSGSRFVVDRWTPRRNSRGDVIVLLGEMRDRTRERRRELTLRESMYFHRLLTNTLPFAVGIIREGRFRYANRKLRRYLKVENGSPLDHPWTSLFHPGDREMLKSLELSESDPPEISRRARRLRGDRVTWMDVFLKRIVFEGKPAMLAVFVDVTKRREIEQRLETTAKMNMMGRLAAGVAHDLNNLLGEIAAAAENLLRRLGEETEEAEEAMAIVNAVYRASRWTKHLLRMGSREFVQPERIDLREFLSGMKPFIQRILGERVQLEMRVQEETAAVDADPVQLEQIVMNLAVNAREAMTHAGRLEIETSEFAADGAFVHRHPGMKPGRYVVLKVTDNGCGIPEDRIHRIFDPFYTTKPSGTGLGLAAVHGIVTQLGGVIFVYSEQGRGTTFKIYLPAASGSILEREKEPLLRVRDLPKGSETILVLDDEATILKFAEQVLTKLGYRVILTASVRDALEQAASYGSGLHLLLTDVMLQEGSGLSVAESIRKGHPNLKVLYMSGYGRNFPGGRERVVREEEMLEKPFTIAQLALKVREVLDDPPALTPS